MPNLHENYIKLCKKYSNEEAHIESLWTEIETQYSESHRAYHNLTHIKYMINKAQELMGEIEDYDILLFAIFYHDIIYNANRKNNEEKSAERAMVRLQSLGVPTPRIENCVAQILATKDHSPSSDADTNLLLDIDLSILSKPWTTYEVYAQNIRSEYSNYPTFLYNIGRKKVLNHLLKSPIYKTKSFIDRNKYAKMNIEMELMSLSK